MRIRRVSEVAVFACALSALVIGILAPPAAASGRPGPDLAGQSVAESIDAILDDPRLAGGRAGVVVRAADTGETPYARDADRRMLPASTQKLLTSAAACEVLGADHRFTTEVLTDGVQRGPVLDGDLYLRGTGDPTLGAADYQRLAAEVAGRGIRVVLGGMIADDTWFDDVRLGADWAWGDEEFGYAAQISALTLSPEPHGEPGSIIVEVHPGPTSGRPAAVRTVPATDHVRIVDRAVTGAPGSQRSVTVEREHGTNVITVSGSIPADSAPLTVRRSVWDPTGYAASTFRDALADHGVRLLGATGAQTAGVGRDPTRGGTPPGARVITRKTSVPLGELLRPMLKLSINGYAEALVKAMGREARGEGTAEAGLEAGREALDALGVDSTTLRIVDGSGLSRQNLVTPGHLADLLQNARQESWFTAWSAGLPVAGAPGELAGGTLQDRMSGTAAARNVRAKTGTLTAVSALAGYVTSADGRPLVFVVLLNNHLGPAPKDIEDRIAVALAEWSEATSVPVTATASSVVVVEDLAAA
jgi:D-alanyl-D-alanine carboxypeptidase/D-alanyl-D-alanine-endopeptidase (penicillin-binding protein 4)